MREMDWTALKLLLEGIEPKVIRTRHPFHCLMRTTSDCTLCRRWGSGTHPPDGR